MKAFKFSIALALLTTLILTSCSDDDSSSFTPSASDISTTIDENPANGTNIGTVSTNITGTLSYSITSQSVPNSFDINSATGVVTINDASNFDFETNPMLTANVSVTNSSDTATSMVTVTLNDVDDIASFLSTSRTDYEAAAAGDWVSITASEYNALAMSLNNTSKIGTSDQDYEDASSTSGASDPFTIANDNGETIPSGSYVFAFKYHSMGDNPSANKVKVSSTSITDGYGDLGGLLPASVTGNNFAVLKGNDTALGSEGFLGIYYLNSIGFKNLVATNTYNYGSGDANSLPNQVTGGATLLYQGLSSTQKQWD